MRTVSVPVGVAVGFILCLGQTTFAEEVPDLKTQVHKLQRERDAMLRQYEERIRALEEKIAFPEPTQGEKPHPPPAKAASSSSLRKTKALVTYYWDTRDYNTFNLLTSTTGLPLGLSFWGFTDFNGTQGRGNDRFDLTRYFMEYRLSRALEPEWVGGIKGLGVQAEYNDSNGSGNELMRFGFTYKHDFPFLPDYKGWLLWRAFPYETNGSGGQLSLAYKLPILDRVSLTGFADLNLDESSADRWVIEPQIGYRLNDRFQFVVEFRYNGFEAANNNLHGEGIAFGIEAAL